MWVGRLLPWVLVGCVLAGGALFLMNRESEASERLDVHAGEASSVRAVELEGTLAVQRVSEEGRLKVQTETERGRMALLATMVREKPTVLDVDGAQLIVQPVLSMSERSTSVSSRFLRYQAGRLIEVPVEARATIDVVPPAEEDVR